MLKYIFHLHIKVLLSSAIEIAIFYCLYTEEPTLCSGSDERLVYEIGVCLTLIKDGIQHTNRNLEKWLKAIFIQWQSRCICEIL